MQNAMRHVWNAQTRRPVRYVPKALWPTTLEPAEVRDILTRFHCLGKKNRDSADFLALARNSQFKL